jgi:hypothetical protein
MTLRVTLRMPRAPDLLPLARALSLQAVGAGGLYLRRKAGLIVLVAHYEHRARGLPNDLFRDGPSHQARETCSTVRPDKDEIRVEPRGQLQNFVARVAGRDVADGSTLVNVSGRGAGLLESRPPFRECGNHGTRIGAAHGRRADDVHEMQFPTGDLCRETGSRNGHTLRKNSLEGGENYEPIWFHLGIPFSAFLARWMPTGRSSLVA